MDRFNLGYSLKNIPIPSCNTYKKRLIEKAESVVKRMRWKALFFTDDQPSDTYHQDDHYGFKSKQCPPQIDEMKPFEDDLYHLIDSISFRQTSNDLQKKMKQDIKSVRESADVVLPADKTRNLYKVSVDKYNGLLRDNITKKYKLAPDDAYTNINTEAKTLAEKLKLDDRMEVLAKANAFITIKDHKENFEHSLPCRLINPAKAEMGVVSKSILDRILISMRQRANLWKNTFSVLEWFQSIEMKHECTFIMFDIVDYYPSISEELLQQALDHAAQTVNISRQDIDIIMHSRKSLLFSDDGRTWVKKDMGGSFDVTMGSFDGAEICELVGALILSKLEPILSRECVGLYRDDGLAILRNASGPRADKTRKEITAVFKSLGLKITVETNRKMVNYLDVTLNLESATHQPYHKPNQTPLYVSVQSNHPPVIIKNIPQGISKRLSSISSTEEVFNQASPMYSKALHDSGYNQGVEYVAPGGRKRKRNRSRQIIWFNPPYSMNVRTNVGGRFLSLIEKHFPRGSKLSKIFNKNNIKVSYSCMPNMASILKGHNKKLLQPKSPERPCNCRDKKACPLHGRCQTSEVVYEASISSATNETRTYTGMCEPTFKTRFANHMTSLRHERYSKSTELSKHAWNLQSQGHQYSISWRILEQSKAYSNISKKCHLCTAEKYHILSAVGPSSLNKRSELVSKCRHVNKFLLANLSSIT